MDVLVLGSSGQVGAYLCDYIENHTPHAAYPFDIDMGPEYDLRSWSEELEAHVWDADYVVFLAFDVGGSEYLKKYQHTYEFIDNNVKMMNNVFEVAKAHQKPVLFASSQMADMSWSPYGTLKALGEAYTKAIGGLVVRFWNVYGVEHEEEKFHVISDFARSAIEDGVIRMKTDGLEKRQFLHATDCSAALVELMRLSLSGAPLRSSYDITSFEWTSILEVAKTIAALAPNEVEVIQSKDKDVVQGVKNDPDDSILELWSPKIGLATGLTEILDHFVNQQGVKQ